MNKIIPILSLCVAILGTAAALFCMIMFAMATSIHSVILTMVSLPAGIAAAVLTSVSAIITFFFRRDKLCRIAFIINLCGVLFSAVTLIIWLDLL